MKLSQAATIIEAALAHEGDHYTLTTIRLSQHGLIAHIGKPADDAECTIMVSALDLEQARDPVPLIRRLTWDAAEKLHLFVAGEHAA